MPTANLVPELPKYSLRDGQMTSHYWLYSPPYDFTAVNKYCDGNPDRCEAIADPESGKLSVTLGIVHDSSDAWGFAGLGHWFVPHTQSPVIVSFNTLLYWSYYYQLKCGWAGQTAHSHGETGVRVFSWDAQGENEQQGSDITTLWDYGVDLGDCSHDGGPLDDPHQFVSDYPVTILWPVRF